jgi:ABC-type branched-subunit amino acid transport system substrate-binding protein
MHRKRFLELLTTSVADLVLRGLSTPISVLKTFQTELRVGALLVTNTHQGLRMGIAEVKHAASLLKKDITFVTVETSADAAHVMQAAQQLVERDKVCAIVGGIDTQTCEALHAFAAGHAVLYFNVASTANALRETHCSPHTFHIAASERMLQDAIRSQPVPSQVSASCATWDASLVRYGADTLNTRFNATFGVPMTERDWNEWFAIKVLWEAFARTGANTSASLLEMLERNETRFDGHKGRPLSFRRWDHQLRQPLYVQTANVDSKVQVIEVPAPNAAESSAANALDGLGARMEEQLCRKPPAS